MELVKTRLTLDRSTIRLPMCTGWRKVIESTDAVTTARRAHNRNCSGFVCARRRERADRRLRGIPPAMVRSAVPSAPPPTGRPREAASDRTMDTPSAGMLARRYYVDEPNGSTAIDARAG